MPESKKKKHKFFTQVASDNGGRLQQEKMRNICQEQIQVLSKVDKGFPDWKGDIYKHLSTGEWRNAKTLYKYAH